jgi:DNA-binding response OmpR family regulator
VIQGIRILYVDADLVEAEMYALALGAQGAFVTVAPSVEEGLATFASAPFDVVVTDLAMPGRDGYDLARSLRAAGADVPIVAVTAWEANDRDRVAEAGFDEHCSKPLPPSELAEIIAAVIARTKVANGF